MSTRKQWSLTKEALERFLIRLDPHPDRALEQYMSLQRKLETYFRCNGGWDPKILIDETFDRTMRRLDEGEAVEDVRSFVRGVARRVAFEMHKTNTRSVTGGSSEV